MCIIAPLVRLLIIMGGLLGRGPMPRRIEDFVNYFAGRPTRRDFAATFITFVY